MLYILNIMLQLFGMLQKETGDLVSGHCIHITGAQWLEFVLSRHYNHSIRPFNLDVPLLKQNITEKALQTSMHSFSLREIYIESIVKLVYELIILNNIIYINKYSFSFPNGALQYTFLQSA